MEQIRVRVWTPDPQHLGVHPRALFKPFALYGCMSGAVREVINVPNIGDMFGMANGGGPPGFVMTDVGARQAWWRVIVGALPGSTLDASGFTNFRYLGTRASAAVLVTYFEVLGTTWQDEEEVVRCIKNNGHQPISLASYEVPQPLLTGTFALDTGA